ncbi:unnamed protein product [Rhodiola kirilowii]
MAGTVSSVASTSSAELNSQSEITLKAKSDDVGWEYAIRVDPKNSNKLKCLLCNTVTSGIFRIKQHIANIKGNVEGCKLSSNEDKAKCLKALQDVQNKKNQKLRREKSVREEVVVEDDIMEIEEDETCRRKRKVFGLMDRYVSKIDPDSSFDHNKKSKTISSSIIKERAHKVDQYVARWMYESAIPFHSIENDSFRKMLEAVGQFGSGYKGPTQYKIRESLLKEEVDRTKELLKKQEEEWNKNGCSIMTDAWSDRKRRSIMNLCVNCPEGTTFLSSVEASNESHTGQYIFEYVDKCIEEIGPHRVVQVVTDNASNNMAAKGLLKLKRPMIFWSSCATHTVNLMLQEIGTQPKFKNVIDKAKGFTIYIYAHHKTLHLMRKFTKKRDIVRPGVTRFATSFLTLQSLMDKKNELRAMVTSAEWNESKHGKSAKGNVAASIVLSAPFWNGVSLCLKVFAPLFKVLRLADGDQKPSMGFLYGELLKAREEIKMVYKNQEMHYKPILEIIDKKAHERLDSPLHLAGYILNPYYSYVDPSISNDEVVMNGFVECVEKLVGDDVELLDKVMNIELHKYLNKEGIFERPSALKGCSQDNENYHPVRWWNIYGNQVPNLQTLAKRVLGLTTSSSGCERTWSTFEGIHTKKRNRLDTTRLNNLVYVQFNAKLLNKKNRQVEKNMDVLLSNEATNAQGWIINGGDDDTLSHDEDLESRETSSTQEMRELEEEFISDEEEEEALNFDFESENEEVLEGYGEEEFED